MHSLKSNTKNQIIQILTQKNKIKNIKKKKKYLLTPQKKVKLQNLSLTTH